MHLGLEIYRAHESIYRHHSGTVDGHVNMVELLNQRIGQLTQFLQAVQSQRASDRVEMNTEEQVVLVDAVRQLIPNAIPENTYTWHGKENIDALIESVNIEVRHLSSQINTQSSYMVEAFDERKTAVKELHQLLEKLLRHEEETVRKQRI